MQRYMFLLVSLFIILPGGAFGQAEYEAQFHYSKPTGDLGDVSDGSTGISFGLSYPTTSTPLSLIARDNLYFILKSGYNIYGSKTIGITGNTLKYNQSGIPLLSGLRLYNGSQKMFVEVNSGLEITRGNIEHDLSGTQITNTSETVVCRLFSVGSGIVFWKGLGATASYNTSFGNWAYVNIGMLYKF